MSSDDFEPDGSGLTVLVKEFDLAPVDAPDAVAVVPGPRCAPQAASDARDVADGLAGTGQMSVDQDPPGGPCPVPGPDAARCNGRSAGSVGSTCLPKDRLTLPVHGSEWSTEPRTGAVPIARDE